MRSPVQMFLIHLSGQLNDDVGEHLRGLLQLVRSAPFQSQVLEARIRLEQAVLDAAEGRVEQAVERAEWAEVRLSTLGRGGRHHAMAVIVRLNILIRADQGLRALHLCSEITRDGKHDPWTIGHTRLIAGRIMAALGRPDEAIRVTWIALCLLNGVNDQQGAIEAAEQSERLDVPKIDKEINLNDIISNWPRDRKIFFCDENRTNNIQLLRDALVPFQETLHKSAVLIGPEGGFSKKDRDIIMSNKCVTAVSLGNKVLRSDTAITVALFSIQQILSN